MSIMLYSRVALSSQLRCAKRKVAVSAASSFKLGITHRRAYFWSPPPSSLVENSGSIARDILATERTFLAWARTGLGFVGAGSALFAAYHRQQAQQEEADRDDDSLLLFRIVPACALLMGNGAFLLTFATRRYLTVISALQKHKFIIDIRGTIAAVVLTAASTVTSLGLIASAEIGRKEEQKKDA